MKCHSVGEKKYYIFAAIILSAIAFTSYNIGLNICIYLRYNMYKQYIYVLVIICCFVIIVIIKKNYLLEIVEINFIQNK